MATPGKPSKAPGLSKSRPSVLKGGGDSPVGPLASDAAIKQNQGAIGGNQAGPTFSGARMPKPPQR